MAHLLAPVLTSPLHDDNHDVRTGLVTLRAANAWLTAFMQRNGHGNSSNIANTCIGLEKKQHVETLLRIKRNTRESFRSLFNSCSSLSSTAKDRVSDVARETAGLLAETCVRAVYELSQCGKCATAGICAHANRQRLNSLICHSIQMLAETIRWYAISYREAPGNIWKNLSGCYLLASTLDRHDHDHDTRSHSLKAIDRECLSAFLFLNLGLGGLRRSEIVAVCAEIRRTLDGVVLHRKPESTKPQMVCDIESGLMWREQRPDCSGSQHLRYFDWDHFERLHDELTGIPDIKQRPHYRSWLANIKEQLSSTQDGEGGGDDLREATGTACRIVLNLLPIIEQLRDERNGTGTSTRGRLGVVVHLSERECQISFSPSEFQRPAVGRLVLVSPNSGQTRIGVIRWIGNSHSSRQTTIGVEYYRYDLGLALAKSDCQWPSGLFVENIIYLKPSAVDPAERSEPASMLMIQHMGAHCKERSCDTGNGGTRYNSVELIERGLDFDLVSCASSHLQSISQLA